jgi:hypothetical protein
MADEGPGWIVYGISVAVATFAGAVIGFGLFGLVAVLVMAGLDATVGIEPPDVDALPDTVGEWVLGVGAALSLVAGAVIGSRNPAESKPTS